VEVLVIDSVSGPGGSKGGARTIQKPDSADRVAKAAFHRGSFEDSRRARITTEKSADVT
jgi:hypothetical protein